MVKKLIKKMTSKERKVLATLGILILGLSSLGTAAWVLGYEGSSATGFIVQSEGVSYGDNFGVDSISTTSQGFNKTENITISNGNGEYNLTADIQINNVDVPGDLCNNSGDAFVIVEYNGRIINDGDNLTIRSGDSVIDVTTKLVPQACPQQINTTVSLIA